MKKFLDLVMIEHTLFALPMALTGAVLAAGGWPGFYVLFWVSIAFTGARTAAMGFNRLVDERFDAANPRTANRHLPSGQVSKLNAWLLVILAANVYFFAAFMLNNLCFSLSPIVLILLLAYSFTKRFTWFCHIFLGICLGLSPIAGWLAVTGQLAVTPIILGLGVVFWVAGFDTIYACQDAEFDKNAGLYSLPAFLGAEKALLFSSISHIICFILFVLTGISAGLSYLFYIFLMLIGGLLIWEHRLVDPDDLTKIDMAFFKVNSCVSGVLLSSVIVGII